MALPSLALQQGLGGRGQPLGALWDRTVLRMGHLHGLLLLPPSPRPAVSSAWNAAPSSDSEV